MSHPLGLEPDQINPNLPEETEDAYEEVAKDGAYHWGKIKEIAASLEVQAKDLQDLCRDFQNNPLFPDLK